MMRYAAFVSIGTVVILMFGIFLPASSGDPEHGKEVYEEQKCGLCHSIAGTGNEKNPLDGVGGKLSEEDMAKWIKTPKQMKADSKMRAYTKLPDKDLEDLVCYLMTLK